MIYIKPVKQFFDHNYGDKVTLTEPIIIAGDCEIDLLKIIRGQIQLAGLNLLPESIENVNIEIIIFIQRSDGEHVILNGFTSEYGRQVFIEDPRQMIEFEGYRIKKTGDNQQPQYVVEITIITTA